MPLKPELLLVDDDPIAIQVLSRMLTGHARLRFARSGAEALSIARQDPPDLMLLDAEMPGMSGMEVLQILRGDPSLSGMPVIVVTSHRAPDLEAEVFELGAVDFLPKPLVAAQVIARVRAQLRLKRIAEATRRISPAGVITDQACVLVVDDDVNAIQLLQATLAPMVKRIQFATDGTAALELMADEPPDLVLLDVQMPGMDGFAVCQAMQQDPVLSHVPVALVTRFTDADNEARGLELGATDFIAKPYRPAVLKARVRNLLRLKQENDLALRALGEHWQRLGDARVSDIVGAASDAILTIDAEGNIALANAAACEMLGVTAEAVLGRDAATVLPGATALLEIVTGYGVRAEGAQASSLPERLELHRVDGQTRVVEPSVSRFGRGEDCVFTLLLRDVTSRVGAEQAAQARLEAEAASRAKSMMLSYIAHEIGNPLNAILGFAQLLEMDDQQPLSPGQARRVGQIIAASLHLQSLVRDVMDVSRFETGNFDVKAQSLDVRRVLEAAAATVAAQAELAGVAMAVSVPADALNVIADEGRLQQCLINLLSNAIKYNRPNGGVEFSARREGSSALFEVCDQGLGMTEDQAARLFEPFNRLGRGAMGIQGAGLGLVVTRMLAAAMQGRLTVSSEVGKGSVFTLALPLAS